MRFAVVFDTPYSGWDHADHERQMELEVAAWKTDEPEMEFQIANALRECGHEIRLLGIRDDLHEGYRERRGIRNVMARPISKAVRARIEETCHTAYRAVWLRDYARLDLRLTPDGQIWVLKANANPFISYGHDMANAAAKAGMEYNDLIQRIVESAMARYEPS